jgi:hypothetical protein
MSDATGFYVILHYSTGEARVGGPFITYAAAAGYAAAKESSNSAVSPVITGPIPAKEPATEGLVAKLRRLAGL